MNIGASVAEQKLFSKVVHINASPSQVWQLLTAPELMKKWMMPDTDINITTDWKVGSPIIIRGHLNEKDFENAGTVLQFEPEKILQYTHLSSTSKLPNRPESYSRIGFQLQALEDQIRLTLTLSNFPTESIYKHLTFYWNVTLEVLKRMAENKSNESL